VSSSGGAAERPSALSGPPASALPSDRSPTQGSSATITARPSTRTTIAHRAALLVAGAGCCVAGMGRFADPGKISGTHSGSLVTGGVYRYSRNPQYLGYLLVLGGAAVAGRSGLALALAAAAGTVFRWWTPIEEQHLQT
jgi:protein-S-isoprenylcysteine O-methyltransferase Ste14